MPSGRTSSIGYGSPACGSNCCPASRCSRAARNAAASGLPGPIGPSKSASREFDSLRLQHNGVGAAFEVDRPAAGLIRALVRNHRVGAVAAGGGLAGLAEPLLRRGDLIAHLLQFGRRLPLLLAIAVFDVLEIADGVLVLFELGAQSPRVVFEVSQFEPRVGQLRFGVLARLFQLLDSPQHVFPRCLQFRLCWAACSVALAKAAASACNRAVRVMASNNGTSAPIVQINTARNGNSEMLGPVRAVRRR